MALKKKTSSFRGKVNRDVVHQDNNKNNFGYLKLPKDVKMYTPVEFGKGVALDFLPYTVTDTKHPDRDPELEIAAEGSLWYKRPFRIHRNVGAGNDTEICLSSFGKRCPICEHRKKRAKSGADPEELKAYNSSLRNLYAVIPLDSKKYDAVIHILDISQWAFQDHLNEELREDEDNEIFPDLEEGKTLKVRFSEDSIGKNKFPVTSKITFVDRKEAYEESILEDVPNLDELLKSLTYEELEAKFFELDSEEDADADKKSIKTKKVAKKPVDEDDEDEEDEEDEEEEPSKPTRPIKSVSKAPVKKTPPKKEVKVPETWDDVQELDFDELSDFAKEEELETDPDDFDEDTIDDFRKAIAEELDIEIPKKKK